MSDSVLVQRPCTICGTLTWVHPMVEPEEILCGECLMAWASIPMEGGGS